jgi:hypothetical protein
MAAKRISARGKTNLALVTPIERESVWPASEEPPRQSGIRLRTIEADPESVPPPQDPHLLVFRSLLWDTASRPLLK